ncbi:MAG: DUF4315 family protein [Oscillospiraceae bacterium]|nr:DUF4315 family protein [Oscillospiraceae bacterium]
MNPKIEKLKSERGKNCSKIENLQSRNKEIDGQITELENLDIIGIVRDNGITPEMLAEIMKNMKKKPLPDVTGIGAPTEPKALWGEEAQRSEADARLKEGVAERSLQRRESEESTHEN